MVSDLFLSAILLATNPNALSSNIDRQFNVEYDKKIYTQPSAQDVIPNGYTECFLLDNTRLNYCFYDKKYLDTIVIKLNSEQEKEKLEEKIDQNLPHWRNNRGQKRWVTDSGKILLFNYPYFLITVN